MVRQPNERAVGEGSERMSEWGFATSRTGVTGRTPLADHYRIDNPMASKLNLQADCVCVRLFYHLALAVC